MVRHGDQAPDSDDMFADTRMSFGDHIEELRIRLWRAIIGFGIGLCLSLFIGQPVLRFIARPVENELQRFYTNRAERIQEELKHGDASLEAINERREVPVWVNRKALREQLGIPGELAADAEAWVQVPMQIAPLELTLVTQKADRVVNRPPLLATMNVTEAFMVYFKVCIVCGIVIGSPWIFFQLWAFVAAGLYPHEKRYVHVYLPFSLGLFLAGVFLCQFFVIPKTIEILLSFNEWIGLEPDLRLNEWLSFAIMLPLVFGVSFQTPLVMLFLAKVGIMGSETFRGTRRIAWFVLAIFAAVITPSVDAISMLWLWVPMCLLFELGIILARFAERNRELDVDVPESEEMVEV
jgi:sec-independent protein translocase protein TatC